MLANLNGWHLVIILAVVLLLFGAAKLPALAKSAGQSARILRGEMKEMRADDSAAKSSVPADTAPPLEQPVQVPAEGDRRE